MKKKSKPAAKKKSKTVNHDKALREHLVAVLKGGEAHVHFMDALDGFPEAKRGSFVEGLPHTGWQLMEHVRIAQWDILEFSRNPKHVSPGFPEGYWPKTPGPPDGEALLLADHNAYHLGQLVDMRRALGAWPES